MALWPRRIGNLFLFTPASRWERFYMLTFLVILSADICDRFNCVFTARICDSFSCWHLSSVRTALGHAYTNCRARRLVHRGPRCQVNCCAHRQVPRHLLCTLPRATSTVTFTANQLLRLSRAYCQPTAVLTVKPTGASQSSSLILQKTRCLVEFWNTTSLSKHWLTNSAQLADLVPDSSIAIT